ncbi:hypothetical protein RsTz2092_01590 [Deferribacterales bacterium RsTz2092]|nr:hypothetical protein AGMMS49941_00040 [Deferribacterales bacterium]
MSLFNKFVDELDKSRVLKACVYALAFAVILAPLEKLITYVRFFDQFNATYLMAVTYKLHHLLFLAVVFAVLLYFPKLSKLTFALLSALCLLSLLELGLLSKGLSELNGDFNSWALPSRRVWDSLIWLAAICGAVYFRKILCQYAKYVVIGLFIYGLTCLADAFFVALRMPVAQVTNVSQAYAYKQVKLHKQNNVFMFLVDATSSEVTEDVFSRNPELAAKFSGFIQFTNNIGTGGGTMHAVPSIMTGLFDDVPHSEIHKARILNEDESLLNYFNKLNYKWMFISKGLYLFFAPHNPSDDFADNKKSLYTNGFLNIRLDRLTNVMRAPYLFKQKAILHYSSRRYADYSDNGIDFSNISRKYPQNDTLDEVRYMLETAGMSEQPTFQYHHFNGGHVPLITNIDCSADDKHPKAYTYENYYYQARCALKGVADILQVLKNRGLYDNATILMLADHSMNIKSKSRGDLEELNGYPFLAFKPRGADGGVVNDNTPISNINVNKFLKEYVGSGFSMSREQIATSLRQDVRKLVVNAGTAYGKRNGVYLTDANYKTTKISDNPIAEGRTLKPLVAGIKYELWDTHQPPVDLEYETVASNWQVYTVYDDAYIKFRVSSSNTKYSLTLALNVLGYLDGESKFGATGAGILTVSSELESISQPFERASDDPVMGKGRIPYPLTYQLPIQSDKDGLVTIKLRNDAGRYVMLLMLKLTKQ